MKLKAFLKMSDDKNDYIEIYKNKYREKLYYGSTENFLNDKKNKDGIIESWYMYVENWDYPVLQITLKGDNEKCLDN